MNQRANPRAPIFGIPEDSDVVILWKSPQKGRTDCAAEMANGFSPADYPGDGPYFATDWVLAKEWQDIYENGLQEILMPRAIFDELVDGGIILRDSFYDHKYGPLLGGSWHVPNDKLLRYNETLTRLGSGRYYPQK